MREHEHTAMMNVARVSIMDVHGTAVSTPW